MPLYSNELFWILMLVFCTFKYKNNFLCKFLFYCDVSVCVCFIFKFTCHFKHICNPLIAELILLTVLARLKIQFSDDRSITGYIQPECVEEKKVLC